EISVQQVTGYSESTLFINGLKEGEKVVIVDDVISTGGTIKAVLESLMKMGIEVRAVITAIEKGSGGEMLRNSFDIPIISLVRIEVSENEVEIKR
ncbi:MAG: adenine phosphoribosyltransferase, partial [Thermoplasmata archaeon]